MKIFAISLRSVRRNLLPIIFVLFTICLVVFSNSNLVAAKQGLTLWANAVVPSLFPFFIATELLNHTNIISHIGKIFSKWMRPLFNIPGEGAYALIMGMISGYPVGAKIVSNLYEQGRCNKEEAERMLGFTNNSGPLFIVGTVGISLFGDTRTGLLLLATHILASLSVGILLGLTSRFSKKNSKQHLLSAKQRNLPTKEEISFRDLGEILATSITNATKTVVLIGGFVVLFSVLISILNKSHVLDLASRILLPVFSPLGINQKLLSGFLAGIIELTNGVSLVAKVALKSISLNMILSAFLLGFGGFSVLLQVFSIIAKNKLSILPYLKAKLLQATLAASYTFLLLHCCSFFNLDILL